MNKLAKLTVPILLLAGVFSTFFISTYVFAASDTANFTLNANVDPTFSLTVSPDPVSISAIPDGPIATGTFTTSVTTTASNGFTLNLSAANPNLVHSTYSSNIIAPGTPTVGSSAWAIKGGDKTNYTSITTSDQAFLTTSSYSSSAISTTFTVGVSSSAAQAAGTYSTVFTVKAVANS